MPVITNPIKATSALKWVLYEMEKRYEIMKQHKVRNIDSYNQQLKESIQSLGGDRSNDSKELELIDIMI